MIDPVKIKQYRDIQFVAQLLGATKRWVWDRVRAHEFRAFQTDKKIHIDLESVQEYIKNHEIRQLEVKPKKQPMQRIQNPGL